MENLKLTQKEIEILKVFIPKQDLNDVGFGSMFFSELSTKSNLSVNSCKGLISSLQSKKMLTVDECNGKPFVCLGNFTAESNSEEIFEYLNQVIK